MSIKKTVVYCLVLTPLLFLLPLLKTNKAGFNENLTSTASSTESVIDSAGKVTIPDDNAEKDYRIKKVVIDAGHGGHDTGCHSKDGVEKKNTLAMALSNWAIKSKNITRQLMSFIHEKRTFLLPSNAVRKLRTKPKPIFLFRFIVTQPMKKEVSSGQKRMCWVCTKKAVILTLQSAKMPQFCSNRIINNNMTASILTQRRRISYSVLFQNAYLDKSILFAKYVEESFRSNAGRRSLGVKQAGFWVLKETAMPSVLIETGFLNHPSEGEFISSSAGQATIAESIYLAFQKYKTAVETRVETPLIEPRT